MKLLKAALLAISTSVMLLPALSVKAQTATQCTQANFLTGNYAGNTITTLPNPAVSASQFVFSTTGAISVLEISNNGVAVVKEGTGTVKQFYPQYCLAQVQLDFTSGDVRNYYFYIDNQGKELRYVQTDKGVVSSGTAARQ